MGTRLAMSEREIPVVFGATATAASVVTKGTAGPIVTHFCNGPPSILDNAVSEEGVPIPFDHRTSSKGSELKRMEGKFEFVGERAKDSDYYVGVIENEGEDGERMLLYRAPHAYSMVQNVCALEELDRAREELYKKQLNSETGAYAIVRRTKDLLTEAFGARKSKLYMRQERAFAVDEKKLAGEVVGKIMQNAVKAQSKSFASDAELQDRAREQKPIPPCVPDAEDPAGAYPLEQMIPRSEPSTSGLSARLCRKRSLSLLERTSPPSSSPSE